MAENESEPQNISIHALLAESDPSSYFGRIMSVLFLSTLSLRRATLTLLALTLTARYFYPRSPCGERQVRHRSSPRFKKYFYPRSPCGERQRAIERLSASRKFLSTLSLRRATNARRSKKMELNNFYPRSPCGERLHFDNFNLHCVEISIHALLAESDSKSDTATAFPLSFLSTLSLRRATEIPNQRKIDQKNFYPRSPCGERLTSVVSSVGTMGFLSTLSLRRATRSNKQQKSASRFLSTLSLRRATIQPGRNFGAALISIHALLAESD